MLAYYVVYLSVYFTMPHHTRKKKHNTEALTVL